MEVNYFTILYWFCHTSTWIHHRYTRVPYPEPSSLLPPRTIPLGRLSAPAPSIQYHALNLDCLFISYMIFYMSFDYLLLTFNIVTILFLWTILDIVVQGWKRLLQGLSEKFLHIWESFIKSSWWDEWQHQNCVSERIIRQ